MLVAGAYLEPNRTTTMEIFQENSENSFFTKIAFLRDLCYSCSVKKKRFTGLEREGKLNVKFSRSIKNNSISLDRKQILPRESFSLLYRP